MHPKDADSIANSEDPDQTALILVCTICSDQSVRKLKTLNHYGKSYYTSAVISKQKIIETLPSKTVSVQLAHGESSFAQKAETQSKFLNSTVLNITLQTLKTSIVR